eukprot:4495338-Amphidinium_carterae.1
MPCLAHMGSSWLWLQFAGCFGGEPMFAGQVPARNTTSRTTRVGATSPEQLPVPSMTRQAHAGAQLASPSPSMCSETAEDHECEDAQLITEGLQYIWG